MEKGLRIIVTIVAGAALVACQGGTATLNDGGAEGGSSSGTSGASGSSGTSGSSGASSSGSSGASSSGSSGGTDDTCTAATDCVWGEIKSDITAKEQCPCLLGCPSLPQNKTTNDRRRSQYQMLCTPGKDGAGRACPIDDCAQPPPLVCTNGKCVSGAVRDGGI